MTFLEIEQQIQAVFDSADETQDSVSLQDLEKDLAVWAETEEDKIDAIAFFLRNTLAKAEFLKSEGRKMLDKSKSLEKRVDNLKAHYAYVMNTHGVKKIAGKIYTASIRRSESVQVLEAFLDKLPKELVREEVTLKPDKKAIKEALQKGTVLEGCKIVENFNLTIQ